MTAAELIAALRMAREVSEARTADAAVVEASEVTIQPSDENVTALVTARAGKKD